MKKIGIFYGSDGGNTRDAAEKISEKLGKENTEVVDVSKASKAQILGFDNLVLATATYGCGELQSDWDDILSEFDNSDFSNKVVALVGVGDQDTYSDTFCDSLYFLYEKVKDAKVVGQTPTDGYEFSDSKAVGEDGKFVGLVLDYDNQDDLNDERISNWAKEVSPSFV